MTPRSKTKLTCQVIHQLELSRLPCLLWQPGSLRSLRSWIRQMLSDYPNGRMNNGWMVRWIHDSEGGREGGRTSPLAIQALLSKYTGILPPPVFAVCQTSCFSKTYLLLQEHTGSLQPSTLISLHSCLNGPGTGSDFRLILLHRDKAEKSSFENFFLFGGNLNASKYDESC